MQNNWSCAWTAWEDEEKHREVAEVVAAVEEADANTKWLIPAACVQCTVLESL